MTGFSKTSGGPTATLLFVCFAVGVLLVGCGPNDAEKQTTNADSSQRLAADGPATAYASAIDSLYSFYWPKAAVRTLLGTFSKQKMIVQFCFAKTPNGYAPRLAIYGANARNQDPLPQPIALLEVHKAESNITAERYFLGDQQFPWPQNPGPKNIAELKTALQAWLAEPATNAALLFTPVIDSANQHVKFKMDAVDDFVPGELTATKATVRVALGYSNPSPPAGAN